MSKYNGRPRNVTPFISNSASSARVAPEAAVAVPDARGDPPNRGCRCRPNVIGNPSTTLADAADAADASAAVTATALVAAHRTARRIIIVHDSRALATTTSRRPARIASIGRHSTSGEHSRTF
jgi:hypothetical protein